MSTLSIKSGGFGVELEDDDITVSVELEDDVTLGVEPEDNVTLEEELEDDITLGVELEGNIALELLEFRDGMVNPFSSTGAVSTISFIINVRLFWSFSKFLVTSTHCIVWPTKRNSCNKQNCT